MPPGLAKGQTYNIGVVVLDVKNRYFAQMLSTISTEAYAAATASTSRCTAGMPGTEREQLTRLADYRVDGIILSSVNEGKAYRTFLESLHRPIVSVDNRIADGIPFVGSTSGQQCGRQCRERQRRTMSASCLSARR